MVMMRSSCGFVAVALLMLLVGSSSAVRPAINNNNNNNNNNNKFIERDVEVKLPEGWRDVADAHPEAGMKLLVALKQQRLAELEDIFWRVSNPKHADYGKHLTIEEIGELIGPDDETVRMVEDWLLEHEVADYEIVQNRDFFIVQTTASKVEKLVNVDLRVFEHTSGARVVKSRGPYSAPELIANAIDFISGVSDFAQVAHSSLKAPAEAPMITPSDLRTRYNVTGVGSETNSQAVAEFQAQYYSPSDLQQFFKNYVNYAPVETVYKVVGSNEDGNPGIEASLDIQYIMGIAPEVQTWFYSTPAFDFWTDLTSWIAQIGNQTDAPWVHSISYGDQGESQPSQSYKDRLNVEFQKLGVRGISIIFASGDSGTGCDFCIRFQPSFPATSPYVTSVGATRFLDQVDGPEAAVDNFGSGGGFSWVFDAPDYQTDAIAHYFQVASELPPDFFYNKGGRGTPDVAALGVGFSVVVSGGVESVAGTSCAAPTFSGVVSLLNDIRLQKGNTTLGFLNNWIYQVAAEYPEAFYDVTVGSNGHSCCLVGFKCAPGWDPVTGVGTPNFAVLSTLV
eukprot:TRINITY_DN2978_c0_g1_i1.p1 TRINITY_DN2978_c0_g1~~TRINITY_DN2978_c0_g1_i1.p1  ORF type:complete len:574 (-),score=173.12 TRINITY_DN2978_c0_g1_i1:81-1772(-)